MKKYKLAIINSHPIQYFAPLYQRLSQESDIDLTVYYCSRHGLEEYYDSGFGGQKIKWDIPLLEGYHSIFLKNKNRKNNLKGFWSLLNIDILKEIYKKKYDAVWIHGHNYATYLLAFLACKISKTPIFIRGETHLKLKRPWFKLRLRKYILNLFYSHCDACLSIGSLNTNFYEYHGVPKEKIFLVPYTVDNTKFKKNITQPANLDNIKTKLKIPLDLPVILFASKFIKRKKPIDLLRAKLELEKDNIKSALIFIGSGEEGEELKKFCIDQKLQNVYFIGFRNQSELPSYYSIADIFVLPSFDEPWGLIINEVMCSGVAIVCSDEIGAVPDLVLSGKNGFTYPAGDIELLTKYLKHLIVFPDICEDFGKKSLEIISKWSYEECVVGVRLALKKIQ